MFGHKTIKNSWQGVFLILLLIFSMFNCESLQKRLDIFSIEGRNKKFVDDTNYGDPEKLRNYIKEIDLEKDTQPLNIKLENITYIPLKERILKKPAGINLIQEMVILPAKIKTGIPDIDRAVFYMFRKKELHNRNIILVAPGGPMNEGYFRFLAGYLNNMIKKDYDIMFYIPPYFLDRKAEGKEFLILNTQHNISTMLASISELRSAIRYLRINRVNSIGLFGGSLGGTMVLLLSILEDVDHVSVMEPVVDWCYTLVKNKYMNELKQRLNDVDFDDKLLCKAYNIISPISYLPRYSNKNIQILYPKFDQYTPREIMYKFKEKWGIKYFDEYNRSHVTVLINDAMFRGYFTFLKKIEAEFRK